MAVVRPDLMMKNVIPVVMAGIIAVSIIPISLLTQDGIPHSR